MKTVIATVTLANPEGGPSLPAGVPVQVDDTNEIIRSYMNSGYMLPVTVQDGVDQPWRPGDPGQPAIIDSGQNAVSGGQVAPDATAAPDVQIQERRAQTESVTTLAEQQHAKEEEGPRSRRRT